MEKTREDIYTAIEIKVCNYLHCFEHPEPGIPSFSTIKNKKDESIKRYQNEPLFHQKVKCLTNAILVEVEPLTNHLSQI